MHSFQIHSSKTYAYDVVFLDVSHLFRNLQFGGSWKRNIIYQTSIFLGGGKVGRGQGFVDQLVDKEIRCFDFDSIF